MRAALITFVPMLATAILVMVGGERLARRELETRTPADRARLLDFDEAFRAELARLDALYLEHLGALTSASLDLNKEQISAGAAEIAGVLEVRVFRSNGKDLAIQTGRAFRRLPEIVLAGGRKPLDAKGAVVLDESMLDEPLPWSGRWLATSDPDLRLHCRRPQQGTLVTILVDVPEVCGRTAAHLSKWTEGPLTPLREAGERIRVEAPGTGTLVSSGSGHHGPAASIIPIRTLFGDWQIRSWDGLIVTRSHDPAVLAIAMTLAALLLASGLLLLIQQKRALRLAAGRVSFVNRVSHELGTPLTNLSLNLDLASGFLETRPAEARRRLGLVAEEIERLSRLVANVLTFSRRERDTLLLKPTRCIPSEVVRRVLESFRPALERRGIEIEASFSGDGAVLLDPDALSQIAGNLISNVEKYAASGGWLGLDCEATPDFLTLRVRDRGAGIPADARQRIFTPFERVLDSTSEGASGTGLGLSIGRDLARRMGGELELLDESPGASFRLRVPAPPFLEIVPDIHAA